VAPLGKVGTGVGGNDFVNERWTGVDLGLLSRGDIYPRGKKDKLLRLFVFLFLFESLNLILFLQRVFVLGGV
jgi:hypothetical protein